MSNSKQQAPSVASGHTRLTEGFSLKKEIASLSAVQCSMKGEAGCFMTVEQLQNLEERIEGMMTGSIPNNASPNLLIDLQEQLSKMTSRAERAEESVKAANLKIATLNGDVKVAKEALEAQKKSTQLVHNKLNQEKADLGAKLRELESKRKHHQKHPSSISPEDSSKLVSDISALQGQLASINAEYKKEQMKVRALDAKVQEVEASLSAERLSKGRFTHASLGKEEALPPLEPYTLDAKADSAILRKVLSTESLQLLQKAADERRQSARQYAYTLLEFAQHRDPKNFIGYRELAKLVTAKIKNTSAKQRKRFTPFLDKMRDSFVFKNAPSIKDLQKEWAEICGDPALTEKTARKVQQEESFSFWEALKHDWACFRLFGRRNPRALKEGWLPSIKKLFRIPSFLKVSWWFHDK